MDEASASRKRRADSDDEEYWKQVTAESKKKRATAAEGLKRTESDRLKEEGATSSESDKKKLLCLNLIAAGCTSSQHQKTLERIETDNHFSHKKAAIKHIISEIEYVGTSAVI